MTEGDGGGPRLRVLESDATNVDKRNSHLLFARGPQARNGLAPAPCISRDVAGPRREGDLHVCQALCGALHMCLSLVLK